MTTFLIEASREEIWRTSMGTGLKPRAHSIHIVALAQSYIQESKLY